MPLMKQRNFCCVDLLKYYAAPCHVAAALNVYFVVEKVEWDSTSYSKGNENANVAALNVNAGNNNQFFSPC